MNLWTVKKQAITSKNTPVGIVPAVHKKIPFLPDSINADIGGGPYEKASEFLREKGVINIVWDPFTRTPEHNLKAVAIIQDGGADTATVANVLNVIRSKADRAKTIQRAANAVGSKGVAYFQVHEGDRSGVGRVTTKGWQEHRKLATYTPEIEKVFKIVTRKGRYIEARQG
jgi:hypothetical protein